jgi:DNA (cytosine-5)-methyltransferase 1
MKKIKVAELFAGVGGFRLGLEKYNSNIFDFSFVNQWEPNKKIQHAYDCYVSHFGDHNGYNEDIALVKHNIPDDIDLLVGGFPCQDYSVATTKAKGIEGKKGVLWWEISWILENKKPKTVLLENVDRLLKSPAKQRGRDFAIMLMNFNRYGYDVEWQTINAADYGFPQRRKRVFIFAKKREYFNRDSSFTIENTIFDCEKESVFSHAFPYQIDEKENQVFNLVESFRDEIDITKNFNKGKFLSKGFLIDGIIFQAEYMSLYEGKHHFLKDILEVEVDNKYTLNREQLTKIKYLKDSKRIERVKPTGEIYYYSEGKMSLCDNVDLAGRTMLTSEGSINRSSHIIKQANNKYRFITPLEAERLNGFDDNWTQNITSERIRYFCMGNALVVGIITKLADSIVKTLK